MRQSFCLLLSASLLSICCVNNGHPKPTRPRYDFKQTTFCDDNFSKDCFTSPEDIGIYTAAQGENMVLDHFSVDVATEQAIGQKFHQESKYAYVNDDRLDHLQSILEKLKPFVHRTELDYKVYLIQDDLINAWTVPGGNIYITTGIYKFAQSEDELANILGHEIGHNECKHTHKEIKRQMGANTFSRFSGVDVSLFAQLASYAAVAFGQHEELESDRTGFYLSYNGGYDPMKGLDFWRRMASNESKNRLMKVFRSHPYSDDRFSCGKSFLDAHRVNE